MGNNQQKSKNQQDKCLSDNKQQPPQVPPKSSSFCKSKKNLEDQFEVQTMLTGRNGIDFLNEIENENEMRQVIKSAIE